MRPLILGMNNPTRAGDPLSPYGEDGAGVRLWKLSGMSRDDYVATFDRENLIDYRRWRPWSARLSGREMRRKLRGRVVVILGRSVWCALGLQNVPFFTTIVATRSTYTLIPHPSRRNLIYNDEGKREMARECLIRAASTARSGA